MKVTDRRADIGRQYGHRFAGQRVGLRELAYAKWLVSFLDLDLGIIEAGKTGLQPLYP